MSTKYTQGPWTNFGKTIRQVGVYNPIPIAAVSNKRSEEETIANAHLISAAPELYTALLECEALLQAHDYPVVLRQVRAVLKKAEGG